MKKVLYFAMALVIATLMGCESRVDKTQSDVYVDLDRQYSSEALTLSDSLEDNHFDFDLTSKDRLQLYTFVMKWEEGAVTETGDTTSEDITTYLKYSYDEDTYFNLDTATWAITTADTTLLIQDVSTGTDAPFLRVYN